MFHIKVSLFARTKSLENKIDLFHDKIIDAAMTFKKAIRVFLNEKRSENYRKLSKQIKPLNMTPTPCAATSKTNFISKT